MSKSTRWQTYPEYKDSGVEWLGEIPAHWGSLRLKYATHIEMGQSPDSSDYNLDGEGTPFLQGNAEFGLRYPSPKHFCSTARKYASLGDFLLSVRAPVGALNIADQTYGIGRGLCAITPNNDQFDHEFAYYSLHVTRTELDTVATGSTYKAVSVDEVSDMVCIIPPLPEQRAIADFLDRETAKIDTLIAKKQQLIELLQEKRAALISHAVTKGLNPNTPMKDSGVEWLGEIPGHWDVVRIKYLLHQIIDTEHKTAPFYPDGEYLVVRTTNVRNGKLTLNGAKYTDYKGFKEWTRRGVPKPGDIIFTREAPAGEACLVPDDIPLVIGQRTVLFRINKSVLDGSYGVWSIYGGVSAQFIQLLSQGSTVAHFNMADIGNIPILAPPLEEQRTIVMYLDRETTKIDALIAKTQETIDKLQEYRIALISAAVTGKIDVRNQEVGSMA